MKWRADHLDSACGSVGLRGIAGAALAWMLLATGVPVAAAEFAVALTTDSSLHAAVPAEEVLMIPAEGTQAPELEVTVYRPAGEGPFPVVVVNHGRAAGPAHMQTRFRPTHVAYEFVRRGYAVVVPMRQGFARSGGIEFDGSCDILSNGRQQARSVRRAVDWAAAQPWADPRRNIVLGQSHGGLATLAYGEDPHPGTRLLVNFSGGLRQVGCPAWEAALVEAMTTYGRHTRLPTQWFYGDNDSHFRPAVWRAAAQGYAQAGGQVSVEAVGSFGSDAHALFGARDGLPLWLPVVLRTLDALGLPTQPDRRFEPQPDLPAPVPLRQALPDGVDHLPLRNASARQGFLNWLRVAGSKAFAISENGLYWAASWGVVRPIAAALEHCERTAGSRCRIFAVDGYLVRTGDTGTD